MVLDGGCGLYGRAVTANVDGDKTKRGDWMFKHTGGLERNPSKTVELITKNDMLSVRELIVKVDYWNSDYGILGNGISLIETEQGKSNMVQINSSECRKLFEILSEIYSKQETCEWKGRNK